jgi:hypothetical protein
MSSTVISPVGSPPVSRMCLGVPRGAPSDSAVRTVDGHLYRIFANLDISNRDQLVHLLSLDRSGA